MTQAYCFASGELEFTSALDVPDGAILLKENCTKDQMDKLKIRCRISYDGKTRLIPGIPEAEDQEEAMDALIKWKNWAMKDMS